MKRTWWLFLVLACLLIVGQAQAACRNIDVAQGRLRSLLLPRLAYAASGLVRIEWFGHNFFGITSSRGTKIFADPFGPMGYPMPDVEGHIVTVGREHGNHNNVGLVKGNPQIFRGITGFGGDWARIQTTVRDVLLYNVPIYQRGFTDHLKGSAFVFEVDGLCIVHLGDLSDKLNTDQLELVGKVDIALTPIGGRFTMDATTALEVVKQLKPKIAVPMHYWNNFLALETFAGGPFKARVFNSNFFTVSKQSLPAETTIYVLKLSGWGPEE